LSYLSGAVAWRDDLRALRNRSACAHARGDQSLGVARSGARSAVRKPITEAKVGDSVEFRGALVQVFENKPFYFVCPTCEKRVPEGTCTEHGSVVPKPVLMVSGVLDDGTANIRAVFFREAAEKALGLTTDEAFKKSGNGINLRPVIDQLMRSLGNEIVVRGYIKENTFFERPEMMVNEVVSWNALDEAKKLASTLTA
jgi:ssDNA-binding replication factor A large subunit